MSMLSPAHPSLPSTLVAFQLALPLSARAEQRERERESWGGRRCVA